ncbi:MAG TPA: DUF2130 domain-containing protein [Chryseolinea sp.]|nr:DUF2130 domain-containing protein [Chryseolinea sp.]
METIMSAALLVKCPHCGNKFSPEESLEHDLRAQFEREFELKLHETTKLVAEKIRIQEGEKYQTQLKRVDEDRRAKANRLKQLEEKAFAVDERERLMKEREERSDLEMKKKLLDREKVIREHAEKTAMEKASLEVREREQKMARERETIDIVMKKKVMEETEKARDEERMKSAELQKKLDDQSRLINEMKRRTEQGSMQTQGEVQEVAIEEYLQRTFPRDIIDEISKGKKGGDCVHIVQDQYKNECGRILYESKRTRHFSNDWIAKIKDDMRLQQAGLGVIVTEALPDGMVRFAEIDGIWVCTFVEFKALSRLFRSNMCRIGEVLSAQENKGEKMNLIYSYVTSIEFKQKLEAAFESYRDMQEDLIKEKMLFTTQWSKREKKLMKAMENLASLYGDVRGIAGGAVQEISGLELAESNDEL